MIENPPTRNFARLASSFMMSCFVLLVIVLGGCRTTPPGEQIPRYQGLTDREILDRLAERADAIDTLSASGVLRIDDPNRSSVTVDAVLLAEGDDRIRLRAWKLGRAVFDLTRDGQALWVWTRGENADEVDAGTSRITAERVGIGWSLMSGRLLAESPDILQTGDPMVLLYKIDEQSETVARLVIDRQTTTVQRCDLITAQGVVVQTITPDQYRLISGIPLATRVTSSGSSSQDGQFTLEINDVELNQALPDSAFTPPSKATRSP